MAAKQWGVVPVWQLAEIGIGRALVSRWVGESRLHRIHPGVYAVGHPALGREGELAAALFYAGKGAALCDMTAAWWLRFSKQKPERVHVCIRNRRRSLPRVHVHQERKFKRVWHNRFPVTPPAQTLLDIAEQLDFDQLRRALSEAEYLRLVTVDGVRAQLSRGRPGSAKLRAALECHLPQLAQTKSALEEEFLLLCERHALTPSAVNAEVAGYRVDAVWFARKLVVELDSHLAHGTPARLENDHRRDLALRAAGYTVRRYTWQQITEEPETVIGDLYSSAFAA